MMPMNVTSAGSTGSKALRNGVTTMPDNCKFCTALKANKQAARFWNGMNRKEGKPKVYHDYTVALVCRSWTKERGKSHSGRTTDFRHRGIGYKLNYCPECGRRIRNTKGEQYEIQD